MTETKYPLTESDQDKINEIMENFDFECAQRSIKAYLEYMAKDKPVDEDYSEDLRKMYQSMTVPSISHLRKTARNLLTTVIQERLMSCGTGYLAVSRVPYYNFDSTGHYRINLYLDLESYEVEDEEDDEDDLHLESESYKAQDFDD